MHLAPLFPLVALCAAACGNPPASAPADLSVAADLAAAPGDDLSTSDDLGAADLIAPADLSQPATCPPDGGDLPDGGACHGLTFGAAAVTIVTEAPAPPAATGGVIPLGAYDAVAAQTTGTTGGTYRASWYFESCDRMHIYEHIGVGMNPPPVPTPRTLAWSTSGNRLLRQQICGGTTAFDNQYQVRQEAAGTFLDVRSGGLMFTFKKR